MTIKFGCLVLGLMFLTGSYAENAVGTTNPFQVAFQNGQELNLSLSNTDINQLSVLGDPINHITCPSNACSVNAYPDDLHGDVYVAINASAPFTMYVSTKAERNFAVQVNPIPSPGTVYQFIPLSAGVQSKVWAKNSDYEQILETLMTGSLTGKDMDGYAAVLCGHDQKPISGQCLDMTKSSPYVVLSQTPLMEYVGDDLKTQIYALQNTSKTPITLKESDFYTGSNIRAISLSSQTLAPNAQALLYEIVGTEQGRAE